MALVTRTACSTCSYSTIYCTLLYTVPLIDQSFLIRALNWVNVEMFILGREVIYPNNRTEFLLSQFLEFDVNVFKASLSI